MTKLYLSKKFAELSGFKYLPDQELHLDFEDHIDATYQTVRGMLEEEGPQLISEIVEELEEVLCITSGLQTKLKQRPTWIRQTYGIEITTLNEAIRLTHGEYEKVSFLGSASVGRTHVFYLDEESLKEYIRGKTTRKVLIQADF